MDESQIYSFEFTASQVRVILQDLFPSRKLVLSQLTFFNQSGIGTPSGTSFVRGRRCYKIKDLLPIALMLALKEQGVPNKNVSNVPGLINSYSSDIFTFGKSYQINGHGDQVSISVIGSIDSILDESIINLLDSPSTNNFFWSYDISFLASELLRITSRLLDEGKFTLDKEENSSTLASINPLRKAVA